MLYGTNLVVTLRLNRKPYIFIYQVNLAVNLRLNREPYILQYMEKI